MGGGGGGSGGRNPANPEMELPFLLLIVGGMLCPAAPGAGIFPDSKSRTMLSIAAASARSLARRFCLVWNSCNDSVTLSGGSSLGSLGAWGF